MNMSQFIGLAEGPSPVHLLSAEYQTEVYMGLTEEVAVRITVST